MSRSQRFHTGIRPLNLAGAPSSVREKGGDRLPIEIRNQADSAELLIMDQIGEDSYGDGVSATSVVDFLKTNRKKPIHVRINSGGGDAYCGLVIFNALASHNATVTVTIEGLAYSAASFIAMAGDRIRMYRASDFGIHRASIVAWGNKRAMQSVTDWLSTIDEHLIDIYQAKTGQTRDQIEKWLDGVSDGTVFSATQCKEHGFCDEILDPKAGNRSSSNGRTSNTGRTSSTNCYQREAARNRLRLLQARG